MIGTFRKAVNWKAYFPSAPAKFEENCREASVRAVVNRRCAQRFADVAMRVGSRRGVERRTPGDSPGAKWVVAMVVGGCCRGFFGGYAAFVALGGAR